MEYGRLLPRDRTTAPTALLERDRPVVSDDDYRYRHAPATPAVPPAPPTTGFVVQPVEASEPSPWQAPPAADTTPSSETAEPTDWPAPTPIAPVPAPAATRVIVLANQKGGVAKTTTTLNLGVALREMGYRILLFDPDPQGNRTVSQCTNPDVIEKSMLAVL